MHRFVFKVFLLALLCIVAVLSEALAASPTESTRLRWEHSGGFVMKGRHWEEKAGNSVNSLVETARNAVFVELFDPARDLTIRLYDGKMLIRGGDGNATKIVKFTKHIEESGRMLRHGPSGRLRKDRSTPMARLGSSRCRTA